MNIGSNILNFRKERNITQEALAAELGVTAAAVSKWEKGYTLLDILMLCALADYFGVTTDELLGRSNKRKQAIVVAQTEELGQKITALLDNYGIETAVALTDYEKAQAVAQFEAEHKNEVQFMFTALDHPLEEREMEDSHGMIHVNVEITNGTDEDALNGIELYLKNMDAFKSITELAAKGKR